MRNLSSTFIYRIHNKRDHVLIDDKTNLFRNTVNQRDVFIYLTEDKTDLYIVWDNFDFNIVFSFVIYFCYSTYKTENQVYDMLDFIGFYDSNYFNEEVIPFNCLNIVDCMAYWKYIKYETFEKEIKTPVFDFFLHEDFGNRHRTIMADIKSYSSCKNLLDNIWDIDNLYTDLHLKIANSPFYEKDYLLS